ncbi:hypothetical protein J6590_048838 [Homalodisca vitripennis]|nr:hypothetical protein J6590_048838 [Homalodisca vitripennis]
MQPVHKTLSVVSYEVSSYLRLTIRYQRLEYVSTFPCRNNMLEEKQHAGRETTCWKRNNMLEEKQHAGRETTCWKRNNMLEEKIISVIFE